MLVFCFYFVGAEGARGEGDKVKYLTRYFLLYVVATALSRGEDQNVKVFCSKIGLIVREVAISVAFTRSITGKKLVPNM